jgi:hypothetical protein
VAMYILNIYTIDIIRIPQTKKAHKLRIILVSSRCPLCPIKMAAFGARWPLCLLKYG